MTQLLKPPGLCRVCGVFEPFEPLRPYALHICPGRRVVPAFPQTPGDQRFERLLVLVSQFKVAYRKGEDLSNEESDELRSLFKTHKARYPKSRLGNWVERQDKAEAVTNLSAAANTVLVTYSAYMLPDFIAAVRNQFADRTVEDEAPCTCFVWHDVEHKWKARLNGFGAPAETDGMTPFWDNAGASSGAAELAGTYAPLNRSIEFHDPKLDMLVHEMIHWCTSPEFHKLSLRLVVPNERTVVREGSTEWLKRNATKDWGVGGYTDIFPEMKEIIDSNAVTPDRLMAAFFRGDDVQNVIDSIVNAYRFRIDERSKKALADQAKSERVILAELLGKPTFSINRSPDFRQRVFNAYGALDDGPLAQQIKNHGWLKYVRARKTGMSDANAHIQAKT